MNWDKFKSLNLREKLQWLLQYYGLSAAIAAAAIIVGAVFLTSVFGPEENYAIRVLILDDQQSADICRVFGEDLSPLLLGECDITSYAQSNAYQLQAFVVRLTSDDLDLVIAPAEEMAQLMDNGYLKSSMELDMNSYYCAITGRTEGAFCIGEALTAKNSENIPAVIDYFINGPAH